MPLEYVKSERGKDQLIHEGYRYGFHSPKGRHGKVWHCVNKRGVNKCRSKAFTESEEIVKIEAHNHDADYAKIEAIIAKAKIKELARNSSESVRTIVEKCTGQLSTDALQKLPSYRTIQRAMRPVKKGHWTKADAERNAVFLDEPVQIRKNQRGFDQLIYEGHRFNLHNTGPSYKLWYCVQRQSIKCPVRLYSTGDRLTKIQHAHNHEADLAKLEAIQARSKIKELAKTTSEPLEEIVAKCTEGISQDAITRMPHVRSLKRAFRGDRDKVPLDQRRTNCGKCQVELKEWNGTFFGSSRMLFRGLQIYKHLNGVIYPVDARYCPKCYRFLVKEYPKKVKIQIENDDYEVDLFKKLQNTGSENVPEESQAVQRESEEGSSQDTVFQGPARNIKMEKDDFDEDGLSDGDGFQDTEWDIGDDPFDEFEGGSGTLTPEPVKPEPRIRSERLGCILCNADVRNKGIQLESGSDPFPDADSEDLVVMFVLRKIMKIPGENLCEYLTSLGRPKTWISSCNECRSLILQAFDAQRNIIQLQKKLHDIQKLCTGKIKSSWNSLETFAQEQQLSQKARRFVATKKWGTPQFQDDDRSSHGDVSPPLSPINAAMEDFDKPPSPPQLASNLAKYEPRHLVLIENKRARKIQLYQCKMCPNLKPMHLQSFVQHLLFHKRRPFKCKECGSYFTGRPDEFDNLPPRIQAAEDKLKQEPDHVCSPETVEPVEFQVNPIWKCSHCSETFDLEESRDAHVFHHHPNQAPANLEFSCSVCSKSYLTLDEWQFHRALEHPQTAQVSCLYCNHLFEIQTTFGYSFLDSDALAGHLETCHSSESYPPTLQIPRPECDFCGKNFDHPDTLGGHLETGHSIKTDCRLSCPFCFARFSRRTTLTKHVIENHPLVPQVPLEFVRGERGKDHLIFQGYRFYMHNATATHKVWTCSLRSCRAKVYTTENEIKSIKGSHAHPPDRDSAGLKRKTPQVRKITELPHICELCGYGTSLLDKFIEHRFALHRVVPEDVSKLKSCEHEGCSFQTFLRSTLTVHLVTKHGHESPWKCRICGKQFLASGRLKRHEQIHLHKDDKPFQCEQCGSSVRKEG